MKKAASILAFLLALCLPAFWSCTGSGENGPAGPGKPDTTKPDTTKPDTTKPDTTKPDTTPVVNADTAALLRLLGTMADTGAALGLESVRSRGFDKETEPVWTPVASDTAGFSYSVRQFGLFKRIHVISRVKAGNYQREKRAAIRVGHTVALDGFPSYAITQKDNSVVLAMNAELEGPAFAHNGRFQLTRETAIQYRGSVKTVQVWDGSSEFAKLLPITFGKARTWVLDRKREVAALSPGTPPPADKEWESVEVFESGKVLAGKAWDGAKILCPGKLTLGSGAVLKDCLILAAEIGIEGDAQVSGLAFASGRMVVQGQPSLRGQFLAGDSIRIDIASPLAGYPIFYVQGQDTIGSPLGRLDVVRASGQGVFLYSGDTLGFNLGNIPGTVILGPDTDLQGLAYSPGHMGIYGRFRGSIITRGPVFYKDPTIYVSFLGYGDLGLAPPGTAFPFAGVLPGQPPAVADRREWP